MKSGKHPKTAVINLSVSDSSIQKTSDRGLKRDKEAFIIENFNHLC